MTSDGPEDRRAVRRRREGYGRRRRVGRVDDVREVDRTASVPAILRVVGANQPAVQRVRSDVDAGESVRAVEREIHLDRVVVDLEVDVVDPREVSRRRVGDVDRAARTVDASAGAVMTSFGAFGSGVTGLAMSVWISVWRSAARYTRTSSIRPRSTGRTESPPICNGFADRREQPRLRLARHLHPVHEQPQRRPVVRRRQMRPHIHRQRARREDSSAPTRRSHAHRPAAAHRVELASGSSCRRPCRPRPANATDRGRVDPRLQRHRRRQSQRRRIREPSPAHSTR